MPIEIRELIIKTEVRTANSVTSTAIRDHDLSMLKDQLLDSCKRMIQEQTKRTNYKR